MSPIVLKIIIRISVVVGLLLLVILWRSIRSENQFTRNITIGLLMAVALVFLINEFGGKYIDKLRGPDPEFQKQLDTVALFVNDNRTRIDAADRKLDSFETLVTRDDWLPEGELKGEADTDGLLLFWGDQLRGEESPDFQVIESDLWTLEDLIEFAADPEYIYAIPVADLEKLLNKFEAPFVIIAELHKVTRPDAEQPGSVQFGVAVVEVESGRLVAYGRGRATNKENLSLKARPNVLMEDLWSQTNTAARTLAKQLTRKNE